MDSVSASVAAPGVSSADQRRMADNLNRSKQTARLDMVSTRNRGRISGANLDNRSGQFATGAVMARKTSKANDWANDLRQNQQIDRQGIIFKAEDKDNSVVKKITSPFRKQTSRALIKYWQLFIESFGATLIMIDLHVFGRYVMGENWFVKLGHEWGEMGMGKGNIKIGETGQKVVDKIGNKIGIVEATLVFLLNVVVLLAIISSLVMLIFIIATIAAPYVATAEIIEWLAEQIF